MDINLVVILFWGEGTDSEKVEVSGCQSFPSPKENTGFLRKHQSGGVDF